MIELLLDLVMVMANQWQFHANSLSFTRCKVLKAFVISSQHFNIVVIFLVFKYFIFRV